MFWRSCGHRNWNHLITGGCCVGVLWRKHVNIGWKRIFWEVHFETKPLPFKALSLVLTSVCEESADTGFSVAWSYIPLALRIRNANVLVHWQYMGSVMHQYIDAGEFTHVSRKAMWAFGINPSLLNSDKYGPHLFHLHHQINIASLANSCKSLTWFLQTLARVSRGFCKLLQESRMVLANSCKSLTWFLQTFARVSRGSCNFLYCMQCSLLQHVAYYH